MCCLIEDKKRQKYRRGERPNFFKPFSEGGEGGGQSRFVTIFLIRIVSFLGLFLEQDGGN